MFPNYYADSLGYNSFYPFMMPQMMNYYQTPYFPTNYVAFQGRSQQQAPNSVITEAQTQETKKTTQLAAVDVESGNVDGMKVYETTPEKIEEYKKRVDKHNTQALWIKLGLLFAGAGLGALLGPTISKAIKSAPNSLTENLLGATKGEQRFLCGLWSAFIGGATGAIYEETGEKSGLKKIAKECLGEPIEA